MSRIRSALGFMVRSPTVLRTLAHLRPAQARAQIRHALFGRAISRQSTGTTPTLAIVRPRTAFLVPPGHVKSPGGMRIELLSQCFDLGPTIDWETKKDGPLFAYHLHQHDYLRLPEFTPAERAKVLVDWIRNHRDGVGWDAHPISLRLLCWGKLLMTSEALEADVSLRHEMVRSMCDQLETLARDKEVRLQANHLLSNLTALVFGGLLFDGGPSAIWRDHVEPLLKELDGQIRPDGGHEERSPMYHSLLLENLLDLLNLCMADPTRAPVGLVEGLRETLSRMLSALELWTHLDGQIALFADSAFDVAAEPAALRDYAARLGIPPSSNSLSRILPQTGYFRLKIAAFDLIASVAGPSPTHQPGHAHCDALAFELSIGGARFVTDTGLFEYLPGARRDRARATASHSTLRFDGAEQAEIWAAHRVGGRPDVRLTAWDGSGSAEATCRGWSRRAPLHRRFFSIGSEGVTIVDRVEGTFREGRICFPIDPDWQLELRPGLARATQEFRSGVPSLIEVELADTLEWALERQPYYPRFGCEIDRFALVGVGSFADEVVTRFRCVD